VTSQATAALRAGAAAILDAEGKGALAGLVRAARVEIAGPPETWTMGSREVSAHHVALVVPPRGLLALTGDTASLDAVRAAFERAMRSPDTELAELHVELLLPAIDAPWARAYRDAPARDLPAPRADPDAVLAGAASLLEAMGESVAAAMLGRARLESAGVPSATPLTRIVVRLTPADRAQTWREAELEALLRRAVHDAAVRAAEEVVVELGACSPEHGAPASRRPRAEIDERAHVSPALHQDDRRHAIYDGASGIAVLLSQVANITRELSWRCRRRTRPAAKRTRVAADNRVDPPHNRARLKITTITCQMTSSTC
jgi:hypothetical protein